VLYAASQRRGLLLGQAGSHQPARKRRRKGVQRRIGLYQRAPGFDFVVRRFNIEVSTRHHRDGRRHCPEAPAISTALVLVVVAATPKIRPKIETVPSSIPKTTVPAELSSELRSRCKVEAMVIVRPFPVPLAC
jgi:hypothetical protein